MKLDLPLLAGLGYPAISIAGALISALGLVLVLVPPRSTTSRAKPAA